MKKLERSLPLATVVAISIGGMLGSGIFVLPGLAAMKTGPSVWLAYLLAGLCVLPAALSKSELATAMPTSGGTYVYIERAFGPAMGTISGLGLWLSLLLKSSFALVGFGAYLFIIAAVPMKAAAMVFLVVIVLLNILGVKKVGKVQLFVVVVSIISLAIVFLFGLPSVKPEHMDPLFTHGGGGLIAATAFVFISYAGVTKVAAIAEEIKNPGRNLPLAMMLSFVIVMSIYVLITYTLVGNIPVAELATDIRPIYTLVAHLGGHSWGLMAAGLGVITLVSMANSGVLAASRFPFAMSRDNLLPFVLRKVHPRFLTPFVTIIVTGVVMALVILLLDVEKIAKLASAFQVMMFVMVNACVIIFRETAVQWYKPDFRSPFYPWVQLFGIVSGIVLLVVLGGLALLAGTVIALGGAMVYFLYGKNKVQRLGVLTMYGHRPALFFFFKSHRQSKGDPLRPQIRNTVEPVPIPLLEEMLTRETGVVVPLFGKERSPEMLVEIGAALGEGNPLQVVSLTEIPDQTMLDAMLEEEPRITSIHRRISAMAEEKNVEVGFEAIITHNLTDTVRLISNRTHCKWMLMGWNGKVGDGLLVRNPMGWLITHMNVNLALFKDNGVRYIRRVLIGMHPQRNDASMIIIADRMARYNNATLNFMRIMPEEATDEEVQALIDKSQALLDQCNVQAKVIVKKDNNPVTAMENASVEYDLMVIGTPEKANLLNLMLGTRKDKFTDHAACSVLRLTLA
ncbi:MAG: amino acid permease [Lewinellaceae bacterium]|nr:amino acid permease [Lewinellaceae bacterium]